MEEGREEKLDTEAVLGRKNEWKGDYLHTYTHVCVCVCVCNFYF